MKRIGNLYEKVCSIENLQLDPVADTTWALPVALTGEEEPRSAAIKFREVSGEDSIYVYTSGYASFAGDAVPCVPVSITGILLYDKIDGREVYQLKMRDEQDVQQMDR